MAGLFIRNPELKDSDQISREPVRGRIICTRQTET